MIRNCLLPYLIVATMLASAGAQEKPMIADITYEVINNSLDLSGDPQDG